VDLDFEFLKLFGLWLDLDSVLKIQEWIWIAKYDSPLISDVDAFAHYRDDHGAGVDSDQSLHFRLEQESIFLVRAGAGVNIEVCAGANHILRDLISVMMLVVVIENGIN